MDYSQINDALFIGTTPSRADYDLLRKLGVQLVINMRFLRGHGPARGQPAVEYLRLRTFDNPLLPIPTAALMRGTRRALGVIGRGGKVYVHCSRGRHRSVAMAAAILIAQGMKPEHAMQLLKKKRAVADPGAAHIQARILDFARCWKTRAE
jgi:dual specificity MAP kinase phosphatase